MEEFIDVINEQDEVIGVVPKRQIFEQKLLHRIAHILIFNRSGEMALQLRAAHKSFYPSAWSTAVGGHVLSRESYEQGALREAKEEIGVTIPLTFLRKDRYASPNDHQQIMLTTFTAVYEGKLHFSDKEVERVEYFSLPIIHEMVTKDPESFHPELRLILKNQYGITN